MDNDGMIARCVSAKCRYVDVPGILGSDRQCRVYSRWVGDCSDCSFNELGD